MKMKKRKLNNMVCPKTGAHLTLVWQDETYGYVYADYPDGRPRTRLFRLGVTGVDLKSKTGVVPTIEGESYLYTANHDKLGIDQAYPGYSAKNNFKYVLDLVVKLDGTEYNVCIPVGGYFDSSVSKQRTEYFYPLDYVNSNVYATSHYSLKPVNNLKTLEEYLTLYNIENKQIYFPEGLAEVVKLNSVTHLSKYATTLRNGKTNRQMLLTLTSYQKNGLPLMYSIKRYIKGKVNFSPVYKFNETVYKVHSVPLREDDEEDEFAYIELEMKK